MAFSWKSGVHMYAEKHPRLLPSIAPMSKSPEANTLPFIVAEYIAQAKELGLRGKKKSRYIEEKVAEARALISGVRQREK